MPKRNALLREKCNFELTMDIIGGKWKGLILYHLFNGKKRFSELKQVLPEITSRMLTLQLRELEQDQVVHREVSSAVPLRVEYSLTELGLELKSAFTEINEWGKKHRQKKI